MSSIFQTKFPHPKKHRKTTYSKALEADISQFETSGET